MTQEWYSKEDLKKMGTKKIGVNVRISSNARILEYETVEFGDNVEVQDFSIIYPNVRIHNDSTIGPNCLIGHPSKQQTTGKDHSRKDPKLSEFILPQETIIGEKSTIRSNSVIYNGVRIDEGFASGHNVVIRENTKIGKNCLIGSNSVLNGYTTIGDFTRINTTCAIPQSIRIGKGVFIAPLVAFSDNKNAVLGSGNEGPIIEDYVRLGVGAIVLPKIRVGEGAVIGSGSVVTKDIESMSINYGNPTKKRDILKLDEFLEYKKSVHGWT